MIISPWSYNVSEPAIQRLRYPAKKEGALADALSLDYGQVLSIT